MKKFLRGFGFAFKGILYCIKNERNMRIHTVVAAYVLVFARFFRFTGTEYAILSITIAMVLAAEAFNTSLERLANKFGMEYSRLIEAAKDAAAGAVLILAIGALGVAAALFGKAEGYINIYGFFSERPIMLAALAASIILALIYIIFLPELCLRLSGKQKRMNNKNDKSKKKKRR